MDQRKLKFVELRSSAMPMKTQVVRAVQSGVCHGGRGGLQHQELLGEHLFQLAGRDAEGAA